MSSFSRLKVKRSVNRRTEATQQLLIFRLQQDWFALSVYEVQKVVQIENLYGTTPGSAAGLALYQNQEISVIDIEQRIYGRANHALREAHRAQSQTFAARRRYLAIVLNPQGELIGLPLNSPPVLRRVPESAFAALPAAYVNEKTLRCVGAIAIPNSENPPIFVLDLKQLLQPLTLPAAQ
jgi:purine-binding chemotaxis protein CheW